MQHSKQLPKKFTIQDKILLHANEGFENLIAVLK